MLEFPRWKYILVAGVLLFSLIFALPNFFGEDPALQIARDDRAPVDQAAREAIEEFLRKEGIEYRTAYIDNGRLMVRFDSVPQQLRARDAVNETYGREYITALSFASRAPDFVRAIGLRPMPLGLDLRGGLYLLYQVDVNGAISQLLEGYEQDVRRALSSAKIPFRDVTPVRVESDINNGIRAILSEGANVDAARDALLGEEPLPVLPPRHDALGGLRHELDDLRLGSGVREDADDPVAVEHGVAAHDLVDEGAYVAAIEIEACVLGTRRVGARRCEHDGRDQQ